MMESEETRQPEEGSLQCPICGGPLVGSNCPQCNQQKVYPLVRREIWLLVLIVAATIPLYLFTREVAIDNRARKTRAAAYWYEQGQEELRGGNPEASASLFHIATMNDRENFEYGLALANALAASGHLDEAQFALLRLRDSAPENAGVNLQLARLAARAGELDATLHYYRNALYGVWQNGNTGQQRREARKELVLFLLERRENNLALSELLLLSAELPQDSAYYAEVGQMMAAAGDPQQALEHFDEAIQLDDDNSTAMAGAGSAAFQLQDYRTAIRYLQAALAEDEALDESRELLDISRLILSRDPAAPRLSQQVRSRRLITNFDSVFAKLQTCLEGDFANDLSSRLDLEVLRSEALTLKPEMVPRALQDQPELVDVAMNLIVETLQAAGLSCGPSSNLDRALLIIGRNYLGGEA